MKRALAIALGAATLSVAGTACADWSVGAGFESFRWKESTAPAVKESGLRWALDLTWQQSKEAGLSSAYNLKLYTGNVDYTGAFIGSGIPVSGETHYRGLTNEIQALYRMPQNLVDVVLAAGWDHWNRELVPQQEETWNVLYARLGVNVNALTRQGMFGSIGVKYPIWTRENAHLTAAGFNQNPRLRPGKSVSLYASAGYRVNPAWDVIAYYDSYRFKESNHVAVTGGGFLFDVFQPKSQQDVIGMKIQYNFQ